MLRKLGVLSLFSLPLACGGAEPDTNTVHGMTAPQWECVDEGDGTHWGVNPLTNEGCEIIAPAQDLHMLVYSATKAELFWTRPAQGSGYVGARVLRDGVELTYTDGVSHTDATRTPGEAYTYTVIMVHATGIESLPATVSDENPGNDNSGTSDTDHSNDAHPFIASSRDTTVGELFDLRNNTAYNFLEAEFRNVYAAAEDLGWANDPLSEDEIVYQDQAETGTYTDPDTGYMGTYTYVHNTATNKRFLCPEGGTVAYYEMAQYSPAYTANYVYNQCRWDGVVLDGRLDIDQHLGTGGRSIPTATYQYWDSGILSSLTVLNMGYGGNAKVGQYSSGADRIVAEGDFGNYIATDYYLSLGQNNVTGNIEGIPTGYRVHGVKADVTALNLTPRYTLATEENLAEILATAADGATLELDFASNEGDSNDLTARSVDADGNTDVTYHNSSNL